MASVPSTKSILTLVQDFAAAAAAKSQQTLDFTVGAVLRALAEATAGVADWLQKLWLFALLISRLQSSSGPWVDSFCADFMPAVAGTTSPRLPARPASGVCTFARLAPQAQAIIPVGTLVTTFDGLLVFQVTADTSNSAYSATVIPSGGYVVAAGVASIDLPVTALTPGTAGNVAAGTISLIRSSVVGIDSVTNAAPLSDGLDAESDASLKARFKLFILALRAGTVEALEYAVTSLQQGLQVTVHENILPDGTTSYGALTLYVDDGSGAPATSLVTLAATAINAVRAAGTRPNVLAATALAANVVMQITVTDGTYKPTVVAAVGNAVAAYIDSLGLEATLPYTMLEHVAYNASPDVTNVFAVTLNGGTADLVPARGQTIKVGNTGVVVS